MSKFVLTIPETDNLTDIQKERLKKLLEVLK